MKTYLKHYYNGNDICEAVLNYKKLDDDQINDIYSEDLIEPQNNDLFKGIVERIKAAKANNEKVMIFGDYDCDGICATTIMADTLNELGIEYGFYIPNRFSEGYGVNIERMKQAKDKGYRLLITVDNGVKATEALKWCQENGIDVILSDHHTYEESDLVYDYFIHPNLMSDYYHLLCGAAVAYQISIMLCGENINRMILAGVATIGDVMPLIRYNRYLVKMTLKYLNEGFNLPLQALADNSNQWDVDKISFQIVPKLNTIGRLENILKVSAFNLVYYLLLDDEEKIKFNASQISEFNNTRKKLSDIMYQKAKAQVNDDDFIILVDDEFQEGLNGLVAGKIAEEFNRPTIVFSHNGSLLKGSIRTSRLNLIKFFAPINNEFVSYGGHSEAAGITIESNQLDWLRDYCKQNFQYNDIDSQIEVIAIKPEKITIELINDLKRLEPFGCGFERPKFYVEDTIKHCISLSNGKHLKYTSNNIEYLYFNNSFNKRRDVSGSNRVFVGTLTINEFRGKQKANMIVDDVIG